jgi:hypothetical protein
MTGPDARSGFGHRFRESVAGVKTPSFLAIAMVRSIFATVNGTVSSSFPGIILK